MGWRGPQRGCASSLGRQILGEESTDSTQSEERLERRFRGSRRVTAAGTSRTCTAKRASPPAPVPARCELTADASRANGASRTCTAKRARPRGRRLVAS